MLRGFGKRLYMCIVRKKPDGSYENPDPFSWFGLNLALDRGPNCICLDHFCGYSLFMLVNVDYDPSHDGKNVGKCTLKKVDLWSSQVTAPYPPLVFSVSRVGWCLALWIYRQGGGAA